MLAGGVPNQAAVNSQVVERELSEIANEEAQLGNGLREEPLKLVKSCRTKWRR
jgi:hypothetical protein